MIDTVILRLDMRQFFIPEKLYDVFTPSARGILKPPFYSGKFIKCSLNPTANDKRKGIYLPRLTLCRAVRAGGISIFLLIEFSAPKIVFNNNYDELTDADFERVCRMLTKKVQKMGVSISAHVIETAEVKAIHFGKNILTGFTTASSIVAVVAKSNITTRMEADTRVYKNNGETAHFSTLKRGVAVYDKNAELKKSKKSERGRIEKDSYCQLSLIENHQQPRPFEVLRIEARYNDRNSIKTILAKTNNEVDGLIFRNLFSSKIAKSVLQYEIAIIEDGLSGIPQNRQSVVDFTNDIFTLNPKASPMTKFAAIGIKSLLSETGSRDIRKQTMITSSQASRLWKTMAGLRYQRSKLTEMEVINQALDDFTPVKLQGNRDN